MISQELRDWVDSELEKRERWLEIVGEWIRNPPKDGRVLKVRKPRLPE